MRPGPWLLPWSAACHAAGPPSSGGDSVLSHQGGCIPPQQSPFVPALRDDGDMASMPSFSEVRRDRFARRRPAELAELGGPAHGSVSLPLHLAWSGLTEFDLDQPRLRMSCYRIVLAEGMREDLIQFLNRDLLTSMWPVLRTLISRDIRDVWESAFAELAPNTQSAA